MRSTAEFKSMPAALRDEERATLEAQVADIEGKLASNNAERSQLDKRLEEGYVELEKLNRAHEVLDRGLHLRKQELAGIDAANKSDAAVAGAATGTGVASGVTVQ